MTDEVERMIESKLEVLSSNHDWVTIDKKLDLLRLPSHTQLSSCFQSRDFLLLFEVM